VEVPDNSFADSSVALDLAHVFAAEAVEQAARPADEEARKSAG
jgi:hypothetical protein